MLRERGRYLWRHDQTKYWLVVTAAFTLYVLLRIPITIPSFGMAVLVKADTLPALIVIFAILATSVWSYWFLLIPVGSFQAEKKWSRRIFYVLFGVSLLVSIALFATYVYAVSDVTTSTATGLDKIFWKMGTVGHFFQTFHLIIYVFIYSWMDLIVARASDSEDKRHLFCSIVTFIDGPILATMCFITIIVRPILNSDIYIFESGVISFQLVVGSLAVVGLEYFEGREASARTAAAPA